jgi:acyl carrier protein
VSEHRDLRLIPDWPRIRQLVALRLGKSEDEIQAMKESKDSLDLVELTMAVEEVLESKNR